MAEGTACLCTGDIFGGAVKELQPRQFPLSSAVFLSFILPGVAEPLWEGKEGGGSPCSPGAEAGNNPWLSPDPQHRCGRTPGWRVPSAVLHGSSQGSPRPTTARNGTARLRGQALFQLATASPARLKAVCVQGSCLPARRDEVAPHRCPLCSRLRDRVPCPTPPAGGDSGGHGAAAARGSEEKGRNLTPINHPIVPAVGIIGFANAIAAAMRKSDWKMY